VFYSSIFAAEPARDKRWSEVHVISQYQSGGITVAFSTDGGSTYTEASVSNTVTGQITHTIADLSTADVSRSLKLRLTIPRASVTGFAELIAFSVTFSLLGEKHVWSFNVVAADRFEQLTSGDDEVYDYADALETLWGWSDERLPLYLTDLQGESFRVQVAFAKEQVPPSMPESDDDGRREGTFQLKLIEV
jgi:hypothetical protein